MSHWERLQKLQGEALNEVVALYDDNFPFKYRQCLGQWIGERTWQELDPTNEQHQLQLSQLLPSLSELQNSINNEEERSQLNEVINFIYIKYSNDPFIFASIISDRLQKESRIISEFELSQAIAQVSQCANEGDLESQYDRELFSSRRDILSANNEQFAQTLLETWLDKHGQNISGLIALQQTVLEVELLEWKETQQSEENFEVLMSKLEKIGKWCESLADNIWKYRQQLRGLMVFCTAVPLQDIFTQRIAAVNLQMNELLHYLVSSTCVIVKQPPEIIKTNAKFSASISLLVSKIVNVDMITPQVRVKIVNQSKRILINNENVPREEKFIGEIVNGVTTMRYDHDKKRFVAAFSNLKIRRADKLGGSSVLKEKCTLLFISTLEIGPEKIIYQASALSLPVLVTFSSSKDSDASDAITWDNALSEPVYPNTPAMPLCKDSFVIPMEATWKLISEALSRKFKSDVGCDLSKNVLHFLAKKAFSNKIKDELPDYDQQILTWDEFAKEPLVPHSFSFWAWFYAIISLSGQYLKTYWNKGYVLGFISRTEAEYLLDPINNPEANCPLGTFLLRFSDAIHGAVSLAFYAQTNGQRKVFSLNPFTSNDLEERSLADRIKDLSFLKQLYVDGQYIPKEKAFVEVFPEPGKDRKKF